MPKSIAETYCGSANDVIEAQKAGVHRVELNSNLSLDGLTPPLGTLKVTKVETGLPIVVMARLRESAFLYTAIESRTVLLDAEALLANGTDGVTFGFLNSDGTVDAGRCREMLRLAGRSQTVFHHAINAVPDWWAAIDLLCELGIIKILTSGQRASVFDGVATMTKMIHYTHGRIEILPGSGVRTYNVQEIVSKAGCTQIHISPHRVCPGPSVLGNPKTHLGPSGSHGDRCQTFDMGEFEKMYSLTCTN